VLLQRAVKALRRDYGLELVALGSTATPGDDADDVRAERDILAAALHHREQKSARLQAEHQNLRDQFDDLRALYRLNTTREDSHT
jgi:hypothetical protein